jgi:hypothetical protein
VSGQGALFPVIAGGSGNVFGVTLQKIVSGVVTVFENVLVTATSTDTFTITRAQEMTTALAWNAGDTVAKLISAADLQAFVQAYNAQLQTYNYALDTGTANTYACALTPALTSLGSINAGMPVRVNIAHANTGASTLNVSGTGPLPVILPNGNALSGGEIQPGINEFFYAPSGSWVLGVGNWATVPQLNAAAIAVGQTIVSALGVTSGIGSGYTSITFDIPVVGGGSYFVTLDSDITTSGVGTVSSRIATTTGSGAVTPVGSGLCLTVSGPNGGGQLIWAQNNASGTTGLSITNNATPHIRYTGMFSVADGVTSVAHQLAVSSGTISIPAGGFVSLLRVS